MNEKIENIFIEWKEKSKEIALHFKNRNKQQAKEPMKYFLQQLLKTIYLGNGVQPDDLMNYKNDLKEFKHIPVNAIERLSFIEDQPDHYQSFIQLSELFSEWEKKVVIIKKRST
ncbi:YpoC family protein [Fictibacillus phosphorivorans]|uniref:YpoC family protein n=1 Tax=Fictibacillus phosphorivorans TaxID=1221500 RepID=UPI003CF86332